MSKQFLSCSWLRYCDYIFEDVTVLNSWIASAISTDITVPSECQGIGVDLRARLPPSISDAGPLHILRTTSIIRDFSMGLDSET